MAEGNSKSTGTGKSMGSDQGEPIYRAPTNFLIVQALKNRPGFPEHYINAERLPKKHLDKRHERLEGGPFYAEVVAARDGHVLYHAYELDTTTRLIAHIYPNRHCSAAAFYSRWTAWFETLGEAA